MNQGSSSSLFGILLSENLNRMLTLCEVVSSSPRSLNSALIGELEEHEPHLSLYLRARAYTSMLTHPMLLIKSNDYISEARAWNFCRTFYKS
jgi:hypothetical protein